mgnify:CR=1 FL=1
MVDATASADTDARGVENSQKHSLIRLALVKTGSQPDAVARSPLECDTLCDAVYTFAKEDGHRIMNSSDVGCQCGLAVSTYGISVREKKP